MSTGGKSTNREDSQMVGYTPPNRPKPPVVYQQPQQPVIYIQMAPQAPAPAPVVYKPVTGSWSMNENAASVANPTPQYYPNRPPSAYGPSIARAMQVQPQAVTPVQAAQSDIQKAYYYATNPQINPNNPFNTVKPEVIPGGRRWPVVPTTSWSGNENVNPAKPQMQYTSNTLVPTTGVPFNAQNFMTVAGNYAKNVARAVIPPAGVGTANTGGTGYGGGLASSPIIYYGGGGGGGSLLQRYLDMISWRI